MTENELRAKYVNTLISWLGMNESNGSHRAIINLYNSYRPLPVGYTVKYTDSWCATFVSAGAIATGLTDIIFPECSCPRMITLFQKAGRWVEDDSYSPKVGDIIMYDWGDSGLGDNRGVADHVGVVVSNDGKTMKIIEGNYKDAVGYRTIGVNSRYIRGYCIPDYAKKAAQLSGTTSSTPSTTLKYPATVNKTGKIMSNDVEIWNFLKSQGIKDKAIAGIMGNIYAESGGRPNNVENYYEKKLGMTDDEYVKAVDNGTYTNFVKDSVGFGLVQHTASSRKQGLYDYCRSKNASIANLEAQLEYVMIELQSKYKSVWNEIQKATSVQAVSNAFLLNFERPADMSTNAQNKRASYGLKFYDQFATKTGEESVKTESSKPSYETAYKFNREYGRKYTVNASSLNIRQGAGTNKAIIGTVTRNETVQCYGYYNVVDGQEWLLVVTSAGTGYVSKKYLR